MLKFDLFKRSRPKELVAIFAGADAIEWVRGRRKWRSWDLDQVQSVPIGPEESPFDCLQRLNLRVHNSAVCACLVIAARPFYSFHREYYPAALADQIQEAITFDWDDNLFYESDRTLHFAGRPVAGGDRLLVPVFSMRAEVYQKFQQALGGDAFSRFTVIPSALAFLQEPPVREASAPPRLVGFCHGRRATELHHLVDGSVVDSLLLDQRRSSSRLFAATLSLLAAGEGEATEPVTLYCHDANSAGAAIAELGAEESGLIRLSVGDTFLKPWLQALLDQDQIEAFGDEPGLKARQVPKVAYPILACLLIYALFALFQIHSHGNLAAQAKSLQQQRQQLETKWKPIEERRARMAQLQEDQKSLTQFDAKGHPVQQLLTLVTEITPADTWLEFFSLNEKELRLRGQSKAAAKYVSELAKVEGFENVSLVSPISRDPRSDAERFYLKIDLNAEKLKQRLQDIEMMAEEDPAATAAGKPSADPNPLPANDDDQGPGEPPEGGKAND